MEDTNLMIVEVPLLVDEGYEYYCSQNEGEEELESDNEDYIGVESLDYDAIHNLVHDALLKKRHSNRRIYGYTGLTLAKWAIIVMIGLLVGLIAFVIESSQEVIIAYKREWTEKALERGTWLNFLSYAATSMALVLLSSCLVLYWAPAAAGVGVTLVMAYLNGNDIPDFFRCRTLFTKILGIICTVSSGLPIGQEGPMVHIGGAIASELTWMHGRLSPLKKQHGDQVRPPQTWQEYLSRLRPRVWVFDLSSQPSKLFCLRSFSTTTRSRRSRAVIVDRLSALPLDRYRLKVPENVSNFGIRYARSKSCKELL